MKRYAGLLNRKRRKFTQIAKRLHSGFSHIAWGCYHVFAIGNPTTFDSKRGIVGSTLLLYDLFGGKGSPVLYGIEVQKK